MSLRLIGLGLLLAACSKVSPAPPGAPATPAAPVRAAVSLPWGAPCRVPATTHYETDGLNKTTSFVLVTQPLAEGYRVSVQDQRLVELNGEDMTGPEMAENARGVLAPDLLVPAILVDASGESSRIEPLDLDRVLAEAKLPAAQEEKLRELFAGSDGLDEQAGEDWRTWRAAWLDFDVAAGQRRQEKREQSMYRARGEHPVQVEWSHLGIVAGQETLRLRHRIEGRDVLGISWIRRMLEHLLETSDVEADAPALDTVFVGGFLQVTYEATFAVGSRRPEKTTWRHELSTEVTGLGPSSFVQTSETRFDWTRAEGCR